jgi:hypothetical protein
MLMNVRNLLCTLLLLAGTLLGTGAGAVPLVIPGQASVNVTPLAADVFQYRISNLSLGGYIYGFGVSGSDILNVLAVQPHWSASVTDATGWDTSPFVNTDLIGTYAENFGAASASAAIFFDDAFFGAPSSPDILATFIAPGGYADLFLTQGTAATQFAAFLYVPDGDFNAVTRGQVIPEPGTMLLLACGLLGLMLTRFRRT